jgi:hypothetical protein
MFVEVKFHVSCSPQRQNLTGFHDFCHLWLGLLLDRHFERQILGKNLSGLVIPGIADEGYLLVGTCGVQFNQGQWLQNQLSSRHRRKEAQPAVRRYSILHPAHNAIDDDQPHFLWLHAQQDCYFLDRHRTFQAQVQTPRYVRRELPKQLNIYSQKSPL